MRNYKTYYKNLILSTTPEDKLKLQPTTLFRSFINKNGKPSIAKFNGYLSASIEIINLCLQQPEILSISLMPDELEQAKEQMESAEYTLTLSDKEKEKIIISTIEKFKSPINSDSDQSSTESETKIICPNCKNSTSFKTTSTGITFKCKNCNHTFTREELIKSNSQSAESKIGLTEQNG